MKAMYIRRDDPPAVDEEAKGKPEARPDSKNGRYRENPYNKLSGSVHGLLPLGSTLGRHISASHQVTAPIVTDDAVNLTIDGELDEDMCRA